MISKWLIKNILNTRIYKRIKKNYHYHLIFQFVKLKILYYFLLFFCLKIVLFFIWSFLIILSDDSFCLIGGFFFFYFFYVSNSKTLFKWVNPKNLIIIILLISIPHGLGLVDYVDIIYIVLCRKVLLLKFLYPKIKNIIIMILEMLILIIPQKKKIFILIC